ncbi:hypothetical protein SAMN06309944_0706 [Micrococcales bacterium KH10]|nr:hypothetical protein SAMN06309944_0706 [Micrococcales bacterium KH10]
MTTISTASVKFPRLQRHGWAFGLTVPQLSLVAVAALAVLIAAPSGPVQIIKTLVFFAIPLFAVAIWSHGQRPVINLAAERAVMVLRTMVGKTRWRQGAEAPILAGKLTIPGPVGGRIKVYQVPYGGGAGVLIDTGAGTATVVLRTESAGFDTASDDDRAHRVTGFARLASSILTHPGVIRVATMARTIPTPSHAAIDYYEHTATERAAGPAASVWAHEQMLEQLRDPELVTVTRDVLVVVSVALKDVKPMIKDAGGSLRGLGHVMAREVASISALLTSCGVTSKRWLTPAELTVAIRCAYDPSTIEDITRDLERIDLSDACPSAVDETWDTLRTDASVHRTMWVRQWPRTDTPPGFLANLIGSGTWPRTVTQVFTPEPTDKTVRAIEDARSAIASRVRLDNLMKRETTFETVATLDDLTQQETQLAEGFAAIRFTGYVTVHAQTDEELRLAVAEAHRVADGLELRTLYGQQHAAFTAGALPLGWGLK